MAGPTVDDAIAAYDRLSEDLAPRYAAGGGEQFIKRHAELLPPLPGPVLDIGAGSGVHADALAARGYRVVAVEPSAGMRAEAARLFPGSSVEWIDDRLPALERVRQGGELFAFILINAVWMHVPPPDRPAACAALASLAAPGAVLSLALRRGPSPADRPMHDCDPDIIAAEFVDHGFAEIQRSVNDGSDSGAGVTFVRLNFRRDAIAPTKRPS